MGRRKKLALTVFSLLLWVQLIFSLGLMVWRYWLISSGDAELYVSTSARWAESLLETVEDRCPEDATLLFLGDDASFHYTRYQIHPRELTQVRVEAEENDGDRKAELLDDVLTELAADVCLLADDLPPELGSSGERIIVKDDYSLLLIKK